MSKLLDYTGLQYYHGKIESDINELRQEVGYFTCNTAGSTAAKTVSAIGFALRTGGIIKIQFKYKNTALNPTLNINSTGAIPLYLNGEEVSQYNTWDSDEVIIAFYDGTYWQCFFLKQHTIGVDNREFCSVMVDANQKVVEAIYSEGIKEIYIPVVLNESLKQGDEIVEPIDSQEWLEVKTDKDSKIIEGLRKDGTKVIMKLESPILKEQQKEIQDLKHFYGIHPHGAIVSFIDDDSGQYFSDTWGEIIEAKGVRIGIACIAGMMAGEVSPSTAYEQMSLEELQDYYNAGHEVYSHSWSHPSFRSATLETIDEQCRKSRDWLNSNGFTRNSDIIVYPGGMDNNVETEAKKAVVRRHYRYGVATTDGAGTGVNPELIDSWFISRCNADSNTLSYLQEKFDTAFAENKLLVVLTHAYELMGLGGTSLSPDKQVNIQRIKDFIDYIQSFNVPILPLEEALNQIYGW